MRACFGLIFLAAVGLGGCGDDVGGLDMNVSPQDLSGTLNSDLAGVHLVTVSPNGTLAYAPSTITIPAGDTVLWTWAAGSHTVTSGSAGVADGKFCSGSPTNPSVAACSAESGHAAGFMYEHQFPTAGSFPYFCNVHGAIMGGTIVVQ